MATPTARQTVNSGPFPATNTVTTATSGTLPSAAVAGNLLVFLVAVDKNSGTFTPASGWTAQVNSPGASVSVAVFTKIAAGGETSASCSWANAMFGYGSILTEYQNCSGVDAVQVPTYSDTARTSMALGPLTPTVDGLAIALFGADSATDTSSLAPAATGWTLYTSGYDVPPNSGRPAVAVVHRTAATVAGTAVPSTTFTWTNSDQTQGAMLLLKGTAVGPAPLAAALTGTGTLTATLTVAASLAAALTGTGTLTATVLTSEVLWTPPARRTQHDWSMFSRAANYDLDVALPIISTKGVLRHMGVSTATATTPFTPEAWTSLQPSRGLVLYRDGQQQFPGRVTAREAVWDATTGRAVINIEAKGDESRLAKRLSFPDPLRAADDQTVNDYWMSRTGGTATAKVASTAMLQLISDQAGPTCRADRQIPGLTLGPDPAVGVSRVWSALFTPVLDQLALMSVASGANLGLRMTSSTGALTATIVVPRDLTDTVVFSADLSNLVGFTYRETEPDVTDALSAGQGDLHLRLRKYVKTTDPLALAWGEQSWSYIDRRDTADVAELQKADQDALDGGGPTVSLAVKLTDSQAATYGVDWGLGDAITVHVGLPGQTKVATVSDVCREIAFEVNEKGVERLTPAIGSYDAKAVLPTVTQQKLTEVASGLSNVARK